MSRRSATAFLAALVLAGPAAAEPDAKGCKDYFVTRLAGYYIGDCEQVDFGTFTFADQTPQATRVEGRVVSNSYRQNEGTKANAPLTVYRNIQNALEAGGWTIVYKDPDTLVARLAKGGPERWVQLDTNGGDSYVLHLAEKGGMVQSVVSAGDMGAALARDGRISLHINFDTGKSTILPASRPIVEQIVALLKGDTTLQLGVEGHTDNVGTAAANLALSQARAQAVVAAVAAAGVAASRMSPTGYGQSRPVADNATEEGRAQNRRVDLVRK